MIADHYYDKWKTSAPQQQGYFPYIPPNIPTQAEIDEFHALLKKAREYDKRNNEPDCELAEKKQRLQKLAKELGIEIHFD